jgi:hypothetical protein
MKNYSTALLLVMVLFAACKPQPTPVADAKADSLNLTGTWRLVSGTMITKGDTAFTDYTKDSKMIKIINGDHFAFLKHDLNPKKDSSNHFDGGGGSYTLNGNQYTEHLDFYSDHNWEGKPFTFTVSISHDTLTQRGMEKLEKENIDREIIERYVKEAK